jgi:hypothetical protein
MVSYSPLSLPSKYFPVCYSSVIPSPSAIQVSADNLTIGGVSIFFKNNLKCIWTQLMQFCTELDIECCAVQIQVDMGSIKKNAAISNTCNSGTQTMQFLAAQTWEELDVIPEPALSWAGDWDDKLFECELLAASGVKMAFCYLKVASLKYLYC